MIKDIKAVIFDVDGTLLDSNGVWQTIDRVFMDERGLDFDEEFQAEIDGMSFHQVADYCHKKYNLEETPDELIVIWHDMAREEYKNNIDAKPGACEFIKHLKKKGIKTAVASSNSYELIEPGLTRNGIYDDIDVFYTAANLEESKDDPKVYLNIARELQVSPEECLVFDDIQPVIKAVNEAGMRSCVVLDQRSIDIYGEDKLKSKADYFIYDFTDIKLEK